MKITYFLFFISLASAAKDNVNLDECYSKTVQDEAYDCIYDKSNKLKNEYNESFKSLITRIKKDKKVVMNFEDLNHGLLSSKKEWDKWLELECSTEANVYQKDTGFHDSIYDTCKIKNYLIRINYYRGFEFK